MNEVVKDNFLHIRRLAKDFDIWLTGTSAEDQRIRNELAGMFAVTIAASYEAIVRETLISYAARFHKKYQNHVEKDFDRLNARISYEHLLAYSRQFGLSEWSGHGAKKNSNTFHRIIGENKKSVERRYRADLLKSYDSLLVWRHAYAHERETSATLGDVYNAHRVGQHVIRSFVKAFSIG